MSDRELDFIRGIPRRRRLALPSQRRIFIALGIYLLIWLGGNLSFRYTHACVRSHVEQRYDPGRDDTVEVSVCDWYSANAKRWTLLDPVRALIHF